MSQDLTMDKVLLPVRPVAEVTRAASKPGDNSTVARFGGRGGKKKEGWNPGFPGPNIASTRSKEKNNERYHKPRHSGYNGHGAGRKDGSQVVDSNDPDLDLILPTTGRKQNLAHLLNMKFQLVPRDNMSSPYWRATHSSGHGQKRCSKATSVQRYHYSKDQYLQANCQFVVKASEDYSVHMADIDLLVHWDFIEQIRLWVSDLPSCPICLHPPVAARMTRCGHVFCWACILHFLALSDKPYRPCPICDVPIRSNELKSVITIPQRQFKAGDTIELHLMKRNRGSTHPERVVQGAGGLKLQPRYFSRISDPAETMIHSKLLLATPEEVVNCVLERERTELQLQWEEEKDCPEACFIQQALDLLAEREVSVLQATMATLDVGEDEVEEDFASEGACAVAGSGAEAVVMEDPLADIEDSSLSRSRFTSCSSSSTGQASVERVEDEVLNAECSARATRTPTPGHPEHKSVFYFYQSIDGQQIFLHTLNVQMLVRQYGSLERCPEVIRGRILERDTLSMTEELRNRLRYLGHLPLTANFELVEIELSEEAVDKAVFDEFRGRVEERERRRRRKDREEQRRDREIRRAEDAKWGRLPRLPLAKLDSQVDFPEFSPDQQTPSFPESDVGLSPPPQSQAEDIWAGPQPQSFAQMLRQGKGKPPSSGSSSWTIGSEKIVVSKKADTMKGFSLLDDDQECAPAPEYKETFSSALAAAFDKAAKAKEQVATNTAESGAAKGKGKKKNKQMILFATGMNFK